MILSLTACFEVVYSPHVPYPAREVIRAVPQGDQGVGAEQDCLRPVGRLGELGEHDARHAGLEHRDHE